MNTLALQAAARNPALRRGGSLPFALLSADSTDAYIRSVGEIPLLGEAEERALAERVHQDHDAAAAQALILANLRFVVFVARSYLGYGLPMGDLIQEGNIGLMKAVKRFDPKVGVRLISFAVHWIRAEIHEFIFRNWRIVRTGTTKAQRKLFFNLKKHRRSAGWMSHSEVEAVARELKVAPEEVREMEQRMAAHDMAISSSTGPAARGSVAEGSLVDEHDDIAAIERQQWAGRCVEKAREGLRHLDPRSRDILSRRLLQDGQGERLEDLAGTYNVSAERIRQIQVRALRKLRSYIEVPEAVAA